MKFNDETKQVKDFSQNWFNFGVHKVQIGLIELAETENGKEYVEFTLIGENGEEDTARMWFTSDKAANFTFNICRQIFVHNAPEEKKDQARDDFDGIEDSEGMVALMNEKMLGGECWFTKYPDPSRTYQAQDGTVKQSINKNVFGYEPKLREDLMPKSDQDNVSKTFPGAEQAEGESANIPKDWS